MIFHVNWLLPARSSNTLTVECEYTVTSHSEVERKTSAHLDNIDESSPKPAQIGWIQFYDYIHINICTALHIDFGKHI